MPKSQYPEHDKLRAVKDKTQAAGEFVEWLMYERGYDLTDADGRYVSVEQLLAEWQGIDREKLEQEKLAMLAELRGSH